MNVSLYGVFEKNPEQTKCFENASECLSPASIDISLF
jgi:hypothetical protein